MISILKRLKQIRTGDVMVNYADDRIEEDIIVCENNETGKIINILKGDLSFKVREGDIIKYYGGEYFLDIKEKETRENTIREKLERLKRRD